MKCPQSHHAKITSFSFELFFNHFRALSQASFISGCKEQTSLNESPAITPGKITRVIIPVAKAFFPFNLGFIASYSSTIPIPLIIAMAIEPIKRNLVHVFNM
ncbi:101aa long hypothetical protein [Pyrococcus horikoshii OT3]|uniref:Uncharacterized protein n=1 Tax=Pyrococcus horikoshii (strain ATCC 700860 / DSM 12428 / JCM 9974 / NBRC 100139 / OT-3) TaxID=70601 RepID=O58982_PYRHO|nr:101aa long hypothetical protein [Pyrococcus horikoshii OT3]